MDDKIMVDVRDVTIQFNLANQKVDNLKEYFIKLVKRELMFQEFLALKNVSFQVRKGEAVVLRGRSGVRRDGADAASAGLRHFGHQRHRWGPGPYGDTVAAAGTVPGAYFFVHQ